MTSEGTTQTQAAKPDAAESAMEPEHSSANSETPAKGSIGIANADVNTPRPKDDRNDDSVAAAPFNGQNDKDAEMKGINKGEDSDLGDDDGDSNSTSTTTTDANDDGDDDNNDNEDQGTASYPDDDEDDNNDERGEDDDESDDDKEEEGADAENNDGNDDDKDGEPTDDKPELPSDLVRKPPKMRLKLSRKLPTFANRRLPLKKSTSTADTNSDDEVQATVVDSDEAGEDEAIAAVVGQPAPDGAKRRTKSSSTSTKPGKRRSLHPTRAIRMPPIGSPGLLMIPPSSSSTSSAGKETSKVEQAKKGYVPPASIFDHHMQQGGYSFEGRTKRPHRGSSVKREVADMFDSNVVLTQRFPPLVPPELLKQGKKDDITSTAENYRRSSSDAMDVDVDLAKHENNEIDASKKINENSLQANKEDPSVKEAKKPGVESVPQSRENTPSEAQQGNPVYSSLPELLIKSLKKRKSDKKPSSMIAVSVLQTRKRKRLLRFSDMVPVSLTIPYPEDFVEKRVKYVQEVDTRERAIVAYQEAREELETAKEEGLQNGNGEQSLLKMVPSIPEPPTPPTVKELNGFPIENYEESGHPLYPPRGKEAFVAHLDPQCFHITQGRYFGLMSNFIADPNFVGPNAPGLNGVNASGGSGLATSTTGGGISGAMALTLSTTYNGTTAGALAALKSVSSSSTHGETITGMKTSKLSTMDDLTDATALKKAHSVGPKPTATAVDLKTIFDEGGDLANRLKDCIIRAAVHASRSGLHGQSFLGVNGKIYPDISKAFSAHGGIKPCARCKSNKQGVSLLVVSHSLSCRVISTFLFSEYRRTTVDYADDTRTATTMAVTAPADWPICLMHRWRA